MVNVIQSLSRVYLSHLLPDFIKSELMNQNCPNSMYLKQIQHITQRNNQERNKTEKVKWKRKPNVKKKFWRKRNDCSIDFENKF